MTYTDQLYILVACLTYIILYVAIALATTRYSHIHQYKHEDDVTIQGKNTAKEEQQI